MAMEVVIGLSCQPLNDIQIRSAETENPAITMEIQNTRQSLLEVGMWAKPWIVEEDKKLFNSSNILQYFSITMSVLGNCYNVL